MLKKIHYPFILLVFLVIASCSSTGNGVFNKKTASEKYEDRIEKISSPKAKAWVEAGEKSLLQPLEISLPYAETGYLSGLAADATSFSFIAKAGQKIWIRLKEEQSDFTAYMELWEAHPGQEPRLVQSADTNLNQIEHVSLTGKRYIFRIHPELSAKGNYSLELKLAPALGFPIDANAKSNIGSFWGDGRDGGSRKHEGIDIFAKKGSYAVASMDGQITQVNETAIGGKVVWLRPSQFPFTIYYAHLDDQFVREGQHVKQGNPIGTVGNTGNAKNTPAHLHYGIYTYTGAVDPLYFVKKISEDINLPRTDHSKYNNVYSLNKNLRFYTTNRPGSSPLKTIQAKTFKIDASTNGFYRVVLTDGLKAFVPSNQLPRPGIKSV